VIHEVEDFSTTPTRAVRDEPQSLQVGERHLNFLSGVGQRLQVNVDCRVGARRKFIGHDGFLVPFLVNRIDLFENQRVER
jgi:hypothetical protein